MDLSNRKGGEFEGLGWTCPTVKAKNLQGKGGIVQAQKRRKGWICLPINAENLKREG